MESDLTKEVKESVRVLAYWEGKNNSSGGFESILKSHMISVITSTKALPQSVTQPKITSIDKLTKIINSVTIMMGNVVRILRDEKNYVNDRAINPPKLECNFQNQKIWENGFLVTETMKELISRFPMKKEPTSVQKKCQAWSSQSPQQYQVKAFTRLNLVKRKKV